MADLLLLLSMTLICGGIGLPIAELLPSSRFAWRPLLAPVFGFAVLSVVATVAYRFGVTVPVIFGAACTAAGLSLAWRGPSLVRRLLASGSDGHIARVVTLSVVAATLILILPRLVGGDQFAVFQGNQWDTYNYLESAVVYARQPYAAVSHATDNQILQNPLYEVAQRLLIARPSVQLLYGVFSRVAPGQAYQLYYAYLVNCFSQLFFVALFIVRNLAPTASLIEIISVALVYPLGFWGQYVFDINAWSQAAAAPAVLLMAALLIHSAIVLDASDSVTSGLGLAAALSVTAAAGVYLYPEGFLIYVAAVVPVALGALILKSLHARSISIAQVVPLTGLAGVAAALLNPPLIAFLTSQVGIAAGKVGWWHFFDLFYLGRDGVSGGPVAFVIDFAAGLFGLYFATPGAQASAFAAAMMRIVIVITILGLLAAFGLVVAGWTRPRGAPAHSRESGRLLVAWTATLLMLMVPVVYLAFDGNYWPAGKAISFAAPVFMLLIALPVVYEFGSRWLRPLRWIVCAFVIFQIGNGLARIAAATRPNGIHYGPPYPAVQDSSLKTQFGWDFGGLKRELTPGTHVLIRRMDVWLDHRLMVFLWSRDIPFVREAEFVSAYGYGRNFGSLPADPRWPDVEIRASGRDLVLHFRYGRPDVRVACGGDVR